MPLLGGKANIGRNIGELVSSKPSKARAKGIRTLARKSGMSEKEAKRKQAIAIALARSRRRK